MKLERNGRISRVALHGTGSVYDYFSLNNVTYQALPLEPNYPEKGRGPNSSVFRAVLAEDVAASPVVLKVCNSSNDVSSQLPRLRRARFEREIQAYILAQASTEQQWVLELIEAGEIVVDGAQHKCILLEKADGPLNEYLANNPDIPIQQRLLLCYEILKAFRALHSIGIYHRDIKPENLLFLDGAIKICDLGLVAFRGEDDGIDGATESIGPKWWMAPEAVNRHLALRRSDASFVERSVNAAADCYQVGKLFWYILQGDVPNGCLKSRDLKVVGDDVFGNILRPLLAYRTTERPSLDDVFARMEPLIRRYVGG